MNLLSKNGNNLKFNENRWGSFCVVLVFREHARC